MVSEPGSRALKWMVNIQWDLVDAIFIGVLRCEQATIMQSSVAALPVHTSAIILFVSPKNNQLRASGEMEQV